VVTGCVAGARGPSPTDPHGVTTTTTIATTTTTVTIEEGLAAYRECLAAEGLTIGEIPIDGLGRPRMAEALSGIDLGERAALDALEACGHHLSVGPLRVEPDPEFAALLRAQLGEFAECVRRFGVEDYPDPSQDFDGVGSPFPSNRIPWGDPDLQSAVDSCAGELAG
jgi:hypothetical protein